MSKTIRLISGIKNFKRLLKFIAEKRAIAVTGVKFGG